MQMKLLTKVRTKIAKITKRISSIRFQIDQYKYVFDKAIGNKKFYCMFKIICPK